MLVIRKFTQDILRDFFLPVFVAGIRVRKSPSGCISFCVHSEDFRNCQQHQKTEGGNYKGRCKASITRSWIELESQIRALSCGMFHS